MPRGLGWIWLLSIAVFMGFIAWSGRHLPEGPLATHFDFEGHPNGSMEKTAYLCFIFLMVGGLNLLFGALYRWIDRFPSALVNIPRKDYWFSTEERKKEAFRRLRAVLCLSGVYLNAVFLLCHQMVYQQNVPSAFFRIPLDFVAPLVLVSVMAFIFAIFRMTWPPKNE